jgi:two-component system, cell cycle response regulator
VELMSHEIMRSRRERSCTAVMMCDIDDFKSVNDQYGHAVGDDVLREVARRLHNSVRSYDMVGRYGGEEFLVALNKCNPESAVSRAENLRVKIAGRPIQTADKPVTVTISIGLALSTEFTQCTVEELMHQADMALYAAKSAGRNCVRVAQPSGVAKPAEEQIKETQVLMP